jgi:nucleoid DNA-binding protein
MEEFKLSLHPEKTRLIEFGRFAAENRRRRGEKNPETFDFLRVYSYLFDNQVESEI